MKLIESIFFYHNHQQNEHACETFYWNLPHVMPIGKMSQNSSIVILRYSQAKEKCPLFSFVLQNLQLQVYLWKEITNFHWVFSWVWHCKKQKNVMCMTSDSSCLIPSWMTSVNKTRITCSFFLGIVHKHLLEGGLEQKGGPLKYLTIIRGALKKIQISWWKLSLHAFYKFSMHNFHGKKGPWNFLRSKGGPQKILQYFFCIRPPLQVFVNSPLPLYS